MMGHPKPPTASARQEARTRQLAGQSNAKLLDRISGCIAVARAQLLERAREAQRVSATEFHDESMRTHDVLNDAVLAVEELQARGTAQRASYEAF